MMDNYDARIDQPEGPPSTLYAPVSVNKFIVLYLLSFGAYGLVWLYRNWRYVKERDNSGIWPLARALFIPPIWYFLLILDLREHENADLPGWLAGPYFLIMINSLPSPYWLIYYLGFLPLLPALVFVNRLNHDMVATEPPWFGWRLRNGFHLAIGAVTTLIVFAGTLGPSTQVVTGDELAGRHLAILHETGVLGVEEELLFFYSPGLFSVGGEGAILTQRHFIAYRTDAATGERVVVRVRFDEIVNIVPAWSSSWLEDTVVLVVLRDGRRVSFVLSSEDGGDRDFITELERLRTGGPVEVLPVA